MFKSVLDKKLLNLSSLVILIPIALVTGPFLSDLIITLTGLCFIFLLIKKKLFRYFNYNFFYFYLAFLAYIIFNSFLSYDNEISFRTSLVYIRYVIFITALIFIIDNYSYFQKRFYIFLLITFFVVVFDAYFQFIFGFNTLGYRLENPVRLSGFFKDELKLGGYLVRLLPILLAFFFFNMEKFNNKLLLYLLIILILINVLVLRIGERTAILLFYIIIFFTLIIFINKNYKLILSFLILSIISFFLLFNFSTYFKERTLTTISHLKQVNYLPITHHHKKHYQTSIKIFKKNILIGSGVNTFRNVCKKEEYYVKNGCSTHPHNFYFQLLAELGLVGLSFLVILLIYVAINIIKYLFLLLKTKNYNNIQYYRYFLFVSVFINIFPFAPSGNFFNNWLTILNILPIGFLFWSLNQKKFNKRL